MKAVIAVDSFKGSISSIQASKAIKEGITKADPKMEIVSLPMGDGGEGTVEAIVHATGGVFREKLVTGPLHDKVMATYGISGNGQTAIIEVASACGLTLLTKQQRNPSLTTTFGVGELIMDAIDQGCRDFIIGLGGSATNDAGIGMLQALGVQFFDRRRNEVGFGGAQLALIEKINIAGMHPILTDCTFRVACDVENALYGKDGAAVVFGPQKGANLDMVKELDNGLKYFASVVNRETGLIIHTIKGGGAAGGLGAAFHAFLNGKLKSGISLVMEHVKLASYIEDADLVITGEGKLDNQTAYGKVPMGVAQLAKQYGVPVIAVAGAITEDVASLHEHGITACFSIIQEPTNLDESMKEQIAYQNLMKTSEQFMRLIIGVK
ncbi:glycerate kinase [Oceanobacillus iheyensis]|nr:glycerate kinase [Oceanobacillus iheyensis]